MSHLAGQHTHHPLLEGHDGVVAALVAVDHHVIMEAHHYVVTQLQALLKKADVAHMEEVEGTSDIHHFVPRLVATPRKRRTE